MIPFILANEVGVPDGWTSHARPWLHSHWKEPRILIEHRCLMGGEDSGTMQRLQRCDGDHVFVPMDVVANMVRLDSLSD